MFEYVPTTGAEVIRLDRRDLLQTNWDVPKAGVQGYHRAICRGFLAANASLAVGVMPFGQRSPVHRSTGEHLLLGLDGEVTWRVNGHEEVIMGPLDLVFIAAGVDYDYWNSGLDTARFVDVIGKYEEWPHSTSYDDSAADRQQQ
jgi:quercetin dioxygenase-like cupin family protein